MDKKYKLFQPSNAEKAFIYQQTQDLISITNEQCPVSVFLEKNETAPQKEYIVTFVLGVAPSNVLARSKGADFMEACVSAKNEMKKKLSLIAQSMEESPERIKFIDEIKKSHYLH